MREIPPKLKQFAERYTAAWCSQNPEKVAEFFAPDGTLTINGGIPSLGRAAVAEAAQSFMSAFPDLRVTMDGLVPAGDRVEYHWTLTGTNSGPGGSGRTVRISGFEIWRCGPDGLIRESVGCFDAADYEMQISGVTGS
jgi:predicted ester cyclase